MKKFSKVLVILISLSLLLNFTLATSSSMPANMHTQYNYTVLHGDLEDYSSDFISATSCIEAQGKYKLACLKNSDYTLTSSIRDCLSDGICTSDVYGEFTNWPSGVINKADYCENDLFIGDFDSKMSLGHEDFIPEQYSYFEYNTDDDAVNSDDEFHKQKADHLLESTFLYEFGFPGVQEYLNFHPMNLFVFARVNSLSDDPYCKSTQKVHTSLGERYVVLFETIPIGLPQLQNRGPSNQASYYKTHLLDGGNPSSNLIYSDNFHLIDNHLLMIYDGYQLQVASMGGALTYDSFPSTFSDPSSYISSLSFEEKCRLLDQSAFRRSTGGIQGWKEQPQVFRNGFNSDVNPSLTTLYYHDYDCPSAVCFSDEYSSVDFEYIDPAASDLLMPYDWVGTNYLSETCYENPITPNIEIYATDFPEFELEGVYPAGLELTFDASGSTPAELFSEDISLSNPTVKWDPMTGAPNFVYSKTYTKTILESESPYQQDIILQLLDAENWRYDYSFNVTVEDMIYADIQTSLSSDQVEPGQDFTIQLSGMTFDGTDLASFYFDPGQREVPNGIFIVDDDGNFQCKETELDVTCLGTNAVYEGGFKIRGNSCGCPVSEGGSGTLYSGQKTATLEDNEFEYEFNFYYPSKTSCGDDRICDLSLNVSDISGTSSVKEIQLYLPGVQSCSGVYSNSIPGSDSSLFVGLVNDGEQSCQCKEGYNRELDTELTALSGGNAYVCERDITVINTTITTNTTWYGSPQTGQGNPTSDNNAGGNPSANDNGLSQTGDEKDTSGLTIFLVLMLLILVGIFGFEFYRKKKTGAFFNPFKKSPITDSPFSESSSQSPIEKFISDAKSAGEDPKTIKQNLKKSGWPDDEINKYLK